MFDWLIVVQLLSHVQLFSTPWTAARQVSLSFTISWNLLKLTSSESVIPSNYLILCCSLRLLLLIFPSNRVFASESALCIRWPKYWSCKSLIHKHRVVILLLKIGSLLLKIHMTFFFKSKS